MWIKVFSLIVFRGLEEKIEFVPERSHCKNSIYLQITRVSPHFLRRKCSFFVSWWGNNYRKTKKAFGRMCSSKRGV